MKVDIQALKAAAEAATPGPWDSDEVLSPWRIVGGEVEGGDGTGVAVVYTDYDWQMLTGEKDEAGADIYESTGEPATIVEIARRKDAAFIAAANPATILALIAEVEQARAAKHGSGPDRDAEMVKVKADMAFLGYGFLVDNLRVGMDRITWFNRENETRLHARPLSENDDAIMAEFDEWIGPRRAGETSQELAIMYWAQEAYRAGRLAAAPEPKP